MFRPIHTLLIVFGLFLGAHLQAQQVTIFGKITDVATFEPVEFASVFVRDLGLATETDIQGFYELQVPAGDTLTVEVDRIGYQNAQIFLDAMDSGTRRLINFSLVPDDVDLEITITGSRVEDRGMIRERVDQLKLIPSASGNFESVLPSIALGTYGGTGGELTSQYNVRGGNYDENLVFINDFEIYRPQLIANSQQEGLSFPNINLISNLSFSSGGFKPQYGDKLSSVLDIRYKRPDTLAGSAELSFLGAGAHLEGSAHSGTKSWRSFRYLLGARYKTTRYILNTLDTEGEYNPDFTDFQAYLTYDLTRTLQLGVLANYNRSVFNFIPQERSTALGLIDFALRLTSVFRGTERDEFTTGTGGISLTYIPEKQKNPMYLKLLGSAFQSNENERFDILGFYRLSQIETNIGSDNFEDEIALLGTGTQQAYTRNFLRANVINIRHKGGIEYNNFDLNQSASSSHFLEWGASYKREEIDDRINEWERLDSAGYSIPYTGEQVSLERVYKSRNIVESNRFSGFIQNTFSRIVPEKYELSIAGGVRFNYWDLNGEFTLAPRLQVLYKPSGWQRDISFKLATGIYNQPPFYRELRRIDGTLNTDVKAQKSFHLVTGFTWDFRVGNVQPKDFRFITEIYYKQLWDLVSYDIDNVKIRYSGENDASGYVMGIDLRMNGEFVKGAESWINLSFLAARETLDNVQHKERERGNADGKDVDFVPRPTDRLMNLSIFFQDYLPSNENFKMNLNMTVGTGLPFGVKDDNRIFRNTYRFSPYHRVDIGFSYLLWDVERGRKKPNHFLSSTRNTWISLEVFNLLEVQNEASNTWIRTIFNQQYAIPNYLTSRRINLRLRVEF